MLSLKTPLAARLLMQYIYSNIIDFRHSEESELIEACIDLCSFAHGNSLQDLTLYLTTFLARRINLKTVSRIAEFYKDSDSSLFQNAYRASKKWIAINLDYY